VQVSFLSYLEKVPLREFWGLRLDMIVEGIAMLKARFGRPASDDGQSSAFAHFGAAESGAPDAGR
jgi:hypothetical protein